MDEIHARYKSDVDFFIFICNYRYYCEITSEEIEVIFK